jgi:hypothetical protein
VATSSLSRARAALKIRFARRRRKSLSAEVFVGRGGAAGAAGAAALRRYASTRATPLGESA